MLHVDDKAHPSFIVQHRYTATCLTTSQNHKVAVAWEVEIITEFLVQSQAASFCMPKYPWVCSLECE